MVKYKKPVQVEAGNYNIKKLQGTYKKLCTKELGFTINIDNSVSNNNCRKIKEYLNYIKN